MKVLFIFNGMVKNSGKLSISGGDIRLLEIIKNIPNAQRYLLTTPNGVEFMKKYDQKYDKAYVIQHTIGSGIKDNLVISIKALFFGNTGVKEYKSDIVYSSCEHIYDVLPALRLKLLNRCKWYAVYHWVEDYPWREDRGNTPLLRRYAYWLNRAFSGLLIKMFADNVLAVSDQTKDKLIAMKHIKSERIKAVYCGVEYAKIQKVVTKYKKEKATKYDAVFMKRLNYGKGVFDLLRIWDQVVKLKPDAKLAIIGDGADDVLQKMQEYITEKKLEKNIDILGVIYDFEEKFRIVNSAKVFLLPTHEENWAIVIGEAMACEVPVIATRLNEIVPIWKDNVSWCDVSDIDGFAKQVLDLTGSESKAKNQSDKAKVFVQQYEWKLIAENELV